MKTYAVTLHCSKTVLIRDHKLFFYGKIRKNNPEIISASPPHPYSADRDQMPHNGALIRVYIVC